MRTITVDDYWMTYDRAAEYLDMSRRTLERAVAANTVPSHRDPLTGRVRFLRSELDDWMRAKPRARRARS